MITLTAINELHFNRWAVARCLVVAPKKVAEATWNAEAAQWDHLKHLRIIPVLGSAQKRIRALNTPGDIWVINRENVPWLVDYYRNGWPFDMVVLDESSSFKNAQSKRFKALKLVRPRIRRLVELTGTLPEMEWGEFSASELGRQLFFMSYRPSDTGRIGRVLSKLAREDARITRRVLHGVPRYRLPIRRTIRLLGTEQQSNGADHGKEDGA